MMERLFGVWLAGAFNHKPLWTGDVWKLQFSAFSPSGGTLRYGNEYKARVWQRYDAPGSGGKRPWLSKLLYGY
ncbi:MAG: hypothetical protein KDC03_20685 [Flavobacteriales bacterium]|nr:hypothetical protein [Flavobacteriales bacterium]